MKRALLGSMVVALLGCGSSSSPPVGVKCTVNTDCANPLSCSFGLCHATCRETRDCPSGHRCIRATEGFVCQLESKCAYRSDCPKPLTCALDRQCRNECNLDIDCATKTQKCVLPDKVCAEPEELDSTGGKLKAAQATPVPDAPDGGAASPDAGALGDAAAAERPAADTGPQVDAPAVTPDAPPDVSLGDIPPGPCGFQDPNEPGNDKRETATALAPGAAILACLGAKEDVDYFELVAPTDNPAGGYFQLSASDVGDGRVALTTYAASDNTIILEPFLAANPGGSAFMYLSAAPGQHYRVLVSASDFKAPFRYTMKATYTKIDDAFEPNDTRATAKPITLGTPIRAYAFSGFTTGHPIYQDGRNGGVPAGDWYKVDVPAGTMKAVLENTAGDVRMWVVLHDPMGTERKREDSISMGAGATATLVVTPGTHYILIEPFGVGPLSAWHDQNVAASLTMPYTLTVTVTP